MNTWIIPANTKYYDVLRAYATHDEIDWRLTSTPEVGDIVYIYLAKPFQCVKFKTKVVGNNIPYSDSIKDEEFYTNKAGAQPDGRLYTRLALVEKYPDDKITRDFLLQHGVKGNIMGARRLSPESIEAIKILTENV